MKAFLISLLVVLTGAAAPTAAFAYGHSWGYDQSPAICNPLSSNTRCTDNQGTTYNPWSGNAGGVTGSAVSQVCAKAVTAAGNLRSASTGTTDADYCGFNTTSVGVALQGSSPDSKSYSYWNGSGGARNGLGHASTP